MSFLVIITQKTYYCQESETNFVTFATLLDSDITTIISYHKYEVIIMIAEKIRALRLERNLSQSELAKRLGLSRNGVNSWEQALSAPSLTYLVELAKFFHVTTDYLLSLSERTSIDIAGLSEEDIALISDIASRLKQDTPIDN